MCSVFRVPCSVTREQRKRDGEKVDNVDRVPDKVGTGGPPKALGVAEADAAWAEGNEPGGQVAKNGDTH
jgi:hypothetical protein